MRQQLSAILDNAITLVILVVAALVPLLSFNQTTEFFDMPKLAFLVVATILLLGMWIFSWIVKGKVVITRTPLDIPLLLLLAVILISTIFSASHYSAIYGNFPAVHGSAVSWVTYILLYFVTVSHLKNFQQIRTFLYVLLGSAIVVSLITILSFFHVYLPLDYAQAVNFTPTGSSFSTIALLMLLLPVLLLSIIRPNKYLPLPVSIVVASLFSVTIILIGSIASYVALLITFALTLYVVRRHRIANTLMLYGIPVVLSIVTLIFAYLPFAGNGNKLQQLESNFPKEIQLPLSTSWKVSASAFRDAPFIGTGPSSYLFNFTQYKPVEFNTYPFWNFSFDTAYNEFLQNLGTLGLLGIVSLLFFSGVVLFTSRRNLSLSSSDAHDDTTHVIVPGLAVTGVVSVLLLLIHAATLVSLVVTLLLLAALMMSQKHIREKVMEFSMGIKASTSDNKQFDLFPVILFIVFLILAVPALFTTYKVVAADYYHRQALAQANKDGKATYQYLQQAEQLNPYVDLYRVDMAQTNFALANALAAQATKGANGKQSALSSQDKQTIQTLLSQAVNEGRASVALSPLSSRNWEVLASIYRNISGVAQNALAFSLDAYGRAIQRDPLNPALRVSVGGIYYAAKNYPLATRFFTDAANLKPDYANAYFNLAIALRDSGDTQNAKLVADQVVALLQKNNPNGPDMKTAQTLDNQLKDAVAKGTKTGGATAPAAQNNSAVQNVQGVNVNNLNNPPSPATPSAVKSNPNTKLPVTNQSQK